MSLVEMKFKAKVSKYNERMKITKKNKVSKIEKRRQREAELVNSYDSHMYFFINVRLVKHSKLSVLRTKQASSLLYM